MRYIQIYDDEWQRIRRRGYWIRCCDCGLTHRQDIRLNGRTTEIRLTRNNRATAAARRGRKLVMTKRRTAKKAVVAKRKGKAKAAVAVVPKPTYEQVVESLRKVVSSAYHAGHRDDPAIAHAMTLLGTLKEDLPGVPNVSEPVQIGVAGLTQPVPYR